MISVGNGGRLMGSATLIAWEGVEARSDRARTQTDAIPTGWRRQGVTGRACGHRANYRRAPAAKTMTAPAIPSEQPPYHPLDTLPHTLGDRVNHRVRR